MTLWPQKISDGLFFNEALPFVDFHYATSAGQLHHRVCWKLNDNTSTIAVERMYARLFCHAMIGRLPDDAIYGACKELLTLYDRAFTLDFDTGGYQAYPSADLRSANVLASLLRARISASPLAIPLDENEESA